MPSVSSWFPSSLSGRFDKTHLFETDDAYITYRYAKNLAMGNGFVYNLGERVIGTTTPLYTLLLAGAGAFGVDIPYLSHISTIVFGALIVPIIFLLVVSTTNLIPASVTAGVGS